MMEQKIGGNSHGLGGVCRVGNLFKLRPHINRIVYALRTDSMVTRLNQTSSKLELGIKKASANKTVEVTLIDNFEPSIFNFSEPGND